VSLRTHAEGDFVVLSISDTGLGIPATELASIFVPYKQSSGGREHAGYGLGLHIAKSLIDAHGTHRGGVGTRSGNVFSRVPAALGAARRATSCVNLGSGHGGCEEIPQAKACDYSSVPSDVVAGFSLRRGMASLLPEVRSC